MTLAQTYENRLARAETVYITTMKRPRKNPAKISHFKADSERIPSKTQRCRMASIHPGSGCHNGENGSLSY